MEIHNPQNCTFIETQHIEHQTVEHQVVQQQVVGRACTTDTHLDAANISAADLTWLRTTWGLPEKQAYILELREALQDESARYADVSHRKKAILFGVMQPRYLKGEIVEMPVYSIANRLFGDLPCFPAENNYNLAVEAIRTGLL